MKQIIQNSLFLIVALIINNSYAQFKLNAETSYGAGYNYNVFNSPTSYINNGQTFTSTDLIDNSIAHQLEGELSIKKPSKVFEWETGTKLWFLQVPDTPNGNQSEYELFFDAEYKKIKNFKFENELDLDRTERLGINILGDELTKSFSYFTIADRLTAIWSNSKKYEGEVFFDYTYKLYDSRPNVESLTHAEWMIGHSSTFLISGEKILKKEIILDVSYKQRTYSDRINTNILKDVVLPTDEDPFLPFDPLFNYPFRAFSYFNTQVTYVHYLSNKLKVKPYLEYKNRQDLSDGDFGYNQYELGFYSYYNTDKWGIDFKFGYANRNYTDRLSEQNLGTPYPLLVYNYTRGKLNIERKLDENFFVFLNFEAINRDANTTNVQKRTRRSYLSHITLLGIAYKL